MAEGNLPDSEILFYGATFDEKLRYLKHHGDRIADVLRIRGLWGGSDGPISVAFWNLTEFLQGLQRIAPYKIGDHVEVIGLPKPLNDWTRWVARGTIAIGSKHVVRNVSFGRDGFEILISPFLWQPTNVHDDAPSFAFATEWLKPA